jgi:hypothetical protein
VGVAEAVVDGAAVGSAVAVVEAVVVGSAAVEAEAVVAGAAVAVVAVVSAGTSGVGLFSELHAAAETEAATIAARPAIRRAQKGQVEPAAMCRRHRVQGTRSRIAGQRIRGAGGTPSWIDGRGAESVLEERCDERTR